MTGPKGQPFPAAARRPRPLVPTPPFSRPGSPVHPRRMKGHGRVGQNRAERGAPSELSRSGALTPPQDRAAAVAETSLLPSETRCPPQQRVI